jgi:hypothetical protein
MAGYPVPAANNQHRSGLFEGDRGAAHELAGFPNLAISANALQRLMGTPAGRRQRDAPSSCLGLCLPTLQTLAGSTPIARGLRRADWPELVARDYDSCTKSSIGAYVVPGGKVQT